MLRKLTVRGRKTQLSQVEGVRAFFAPGSNKSAAAAVIENEGGSQLPTVAEHVAPERRQALSAFGRGGWVFARPEAEPAITNVTGPQLTGEVLVTAANVPVIAHGRLVVRLEDNSAQAEAQAIAADLGLAILRPLSFSPDQRIYLMAVTGGADVFAVADALQQTAGVLYAEPELVAATSPRWTPKDKHFSKQWQHGTVGMQSAWDEGLGDEMRLAIIDLGFHVSHPDFTGAVDAACAAVFQEDSNGGSFVLGVKKYPAHEHGTLCAGMAAARTNTKGVCGSAPECTLIPVAIRGTSSQVTLARAIGYAVNPSLEVSANAAPGAHVIACSLGSTLEEWDMASVLSDALDYTRHGRDSLGTPVFWATANFSSSTELDPLARHAATIAVGKANIFNQPGSGAFGPDLDFLAPGVGVYTMIGKKGYGVGSGTSVATPYTAGVAALMLAANRALTAEQVRDILRETCLKIGAKHDAAGRDEICGYGLIQADAAVRKAVEMMNPL